MPADFSLVAPIFLSVKPGDIVIVEEESEIIGNLQASWWIGQVIHAIGGARSSSQNSLFQIANLDTGVIRVINADLVTKILIKYPTE